MYLTVGDFKLLSFSVCQVLAVVSRDCGIRYRPQDEEVLYGCAVMWVLRGPVCPGPSLAGPLLQ